ncbi:hypothetical protein ACGFMK_35655 [Amycolatopsis sp. NPDC049252]|uniref:hypothetical protein n=1 Tax=Amycolatopsis sp. NPDC049252 TaxID=3363933 RepID=UPI003713AF2E
MMLTVADKQDHGGKPTFKELLECQVRTMRPFRKPALHQKNAGGIACTVRDTRGQDIAAACGQLAAKD